MITATVVNQKGGVGKTTICQNLGYLLSTEYGKKVLLIDLDSSANLTTIFEVTSNRDRMFGAPSVIVDEDADPAKNILPTKYPNLYIMPGSEALARVEDKIRTDIDAPQQTRLASQLNKVSNDYDFCLIDCPPSVQGSVLVINALACSDDVIIPCSPNFDGIGGVAKVAEIAGKVRKNFNPKLSIRGVVYTMIRPRMTFDRQLLEMKLQVPRFRTYIRFSDGVATYSRANFVAYHEYNAKSSGSIDMDNLAAEYIGAEYPHPEALPDPLPEY